MKYRIGPTAMIALAFVFASGIASASVDAARPAAQPAASTNAAKPGKSRPAMRMVDINSASKTELKALSGIDEARANKIIVGRPYLTKAQLVTRNIIPAGVYEQIKDEIIAKQK
jgi:DNA uptake protein ComE-like DNA-binding protein